MGQSLAYRGVLFDLDGTLVDSLSVTVEAFNQGILSQGGKRHTFEELSRYFGPRESKVFEAIVGEDLADAAYSVCRAYLDQNMGRLPLHAGVREVLDSLKQASVPVSIVTGRSWDTTELILKHHGILDRFVTVVADNHVSQPKPAPDGLALALGRMGLGPKEVFYVGDSGMDMLAAKRVGCAGVAALWDRLANPAQLALHAPAFFARDPAQVLDFLRGGV